MWVCAPKGFKPGQVIPNPVTLAADPSKAWLSASIEEALDRQQLLQIIKGWATTIQAVK